VGWICINVLPGGDCAASFSGASCPPWRSALQVAVPKCPAAWKIPSLRARPPISNGPPINNRPPVNSRRPHCSLLRAQRLLSASHCRRLNRPNRNMCLHPQRHSTSSLNIPHLNMRSLSPLRLNMLSLSTLRLNMLNLSTLRLNMRSLSTLRLNMSRPNIPHLNIPHLNILRRNTLRRNTPRLNIPSLNIPRRPMNSRRHEQRPITLERSAPAKSSRTRPRRACRRQPQCRRLHRCR